MPKEGCARGIAKRRKVNIKLGHRLDIKAPKEFPPTVSLDKPTDEVYTISDDHLELAEEPWEKKTKKMRTYFQSRYIQSISEPPFHMSDEAAANIRSKVLPNCLMDDPDYYVQLDPPKNYDVCMHNSPVGDHFYLTIDDFQVLRGKGWLNTDVITSVSYMLLQQDSSRSSVIVHDNVGTAAIVKGDKICKDSWILKSSNINDKTEKIFFPINISQLHWVLVYANLNHKTFAYINSSVNKDDELTVVAAFHNFLTFISDVTQTDHIALKDKWEVKDYSHPLQDDGYNCGVFMLYYIEQLIVGDRINLPFNPDVHRSTLMRKLIRTSENMENVCLPCRLRHNPCLPSNTSSESVECTSCCRWFHIYKDGCLPDDVPKDVTVLDKTIVSVFCRLCRLYYNRLKQSASLNCA